MTTDPFRPSRRSRRFWAATLASLVLLAGAAGWLQWWNARTTDAALEALASQQDRIVLALQWKGVVENVGERVLAAHAATDPSLSALIDGRTRVGLGRAAAMQARIARIATGAQDVAALERIAGERMAVMDLDRRMHELRAAGDAVGLRSFVAERYLPTIGGYAVALDEFVQLQVQRRDDLAAELRRAREQVRVQYACVAAMLLGLALALGRALLAPRREPGAPRGGPDGGGAQAAAFPQPASGAPAPAAGAPRAAADAPWHAGLRLEA
ncbi:MAG: hypothetical protein PGN26_10785 [Xylophilus ampelinus]